MDQDEQFNQYKKILQLLIKRKYPDFVFINSYHWCNDSCCLLCGKDFKPITDSTCEEAGEHIIMHLKEKNLLPFT